MKYPTYPKEMRERAKREGNYLVTVDFVRPNGSRELSSQGPLTKAQAKVIADAWLKVIKERSAS